LQTLKAISLINRSIWEKNGYSEELKHPTILLSHSLKKAELASLFLKQATEEFVVLQTFEDS